MARALALVLCGILVGSTATWWWAGSGPDRQPPHREPLAPGSAPDSLAARARPPAELVPALDEPHRPDASPTSPADLRAVLAALERLDARLGHLESAAARQPDARAPATELAEVAARLREVERLLALQGERLVELAPDAGLAELARERGEADWESLEEFRRRFRGDDSGATGELRLLGYRDVIDRFGAPTESWSNERGTHWIYGDGHDAAEGGYQREVYVRFQDGLVTLAGAK